MAISDHSNTKTTDLTEESFEEFRQWCSQPYFSLERGRLLSPEPTAREVAYPPIRWKHLNSFWQDGLRFDVWVNWDGRARIEHDGCVILRMWTPAGDILAAAEERRKATGGG